MKQEKNYQILYKLSQYNCAGFPFSSDVENVSTCKCLEVAETPIVHLSLQLIPESLSAHQHPCMCLVSQPSRCVSAARLPVTKTWPTHPQSGQGELLWSLLLALGVSVSLSGWHSTQTTGEGSRQGHWPWQAAFPKGLGPAPALRHSPFPVGLTGKANSGQGFQEQMHCYGHSKVKSDIQLAKLAQLKVILQQLWTNSAGSGPGGEFELLDKCSASLCLPFMFRESYS